VAIDTLQPIVDRYSSAGLTRADIWALSAFVGVEQTMPSTDRISFPFSFYGRLECTSDMTSGPDPELCHPDAGTNEVLEFFARDFGYSTTEVAAIMGAHTIGVLRRQDLGFDGLTGWVQGTNICRVQYSIYGCQNIIQPTHLIFIHFDSTALFLQIISRLIMDITKPSQGPMGT